MRNFIPLSVPNLKGNELEYVSNAIKDEWVSTAGAQITTFEKNISKYVSSIDAVACQSGTAGLHLALLAYDVGVNDEVIVPALTFIATVNPVKYVGAEPVFMDCDDSLCIDLNKLAEFCESECFFRDGNLFNKLTNKHIKAIICVHIFGSMADMESLMTLANKFNLVVIEDATEALGSYYTSGCYKGRYAGAIGDIGVYSFNGNKIITTGGGGAVVSSDKIKLEYIRYLSKQAKDDEMYFDHSNIGYNYRMTNLQATMGIAQLEQLEEFIKIKKINYDRYVENRIELIQFSDIIRPNYWFYSYKTNRRDELISYLNAKQIQSRPIWRLINTLKPYLGCQEYKVEKAYEYLSRVVNLPCSTNLSLDEVDYICMNIKQFEAN